MVKNKLLSGRVKVTPSANVTADRYQFLGLEQAEPNLGQGTDGFVLTYDSNSPGERLWAPGGLESGLAYEHANAAYAAANNAVDTWVRDAANSASSYANSAFDQANTASQEAVTSGDYANSAYTQANTASQDATSAGSYANSAYAAANNKLDLTGGTITGDLAVAGNLTITGNTTQISVTSLNVSDPIIYLAANNYDSDIVGIGFAGNYNDGTTNRHAGLIRMEASNTFYLFTNYDEEFDTNTLDLSNPSLLEATLKANVVANTVTVRNVEVLTQANAAFTAANTADQKAVTSGSYANSAYIHANAAFNAANNAVDTWVRDAANSASSYANGAFAAANTADQKAVSAGSYANGAFAAANTADQKAVTSGVYANSAYIHANAAFDAANNATDAWVRDAANSASSYANGAFAIGNTANTLAQAAYDAANNATDTWVRDAANASSSYANSAYIHANAAFDAANNAVDTWVRDAANSASSYANSGYTHANSAFDKANAAYTIVNSSFAVSMTLDTFTGDSSCTTFTLSTSPSSENYTLVTLNGLVQHKSAYNISGADVVFSEAPSTNVAIDVISFASNPVNPYGVNITLDAFTGDNSCTTFALSTTPSSENYTSVVIDGVTQLKTSYNISGSDIVFSEAPGTDTNIEVTTYGAYTPTSVGVSITVDEFVGDNVTTNFTLSVTPTSEDYTTVSIDGTLQHKTAYSVSGTTLSFSEAPPDSSNIEVSIYQSADVYASNTLSQIARDHANAAFDAANNATDTWVRNAANAASSYANAAFVVANTAEILAQAAFDTANNATDAWVRDAANSASSYANSAFNQANTANTLAQAAYDAANNAVDTWVRDAANSASSYANGAFVAANTADQKAVSAGSYANGAFTAANTADQRAVTSGDYANSAYTQANTGTQYAQSAGSYANGAFVAANTADQRAVTSGAYANSAYIHANAAYAAANNKVDTTGGTITGDLTISGNLTVSGNTIQVDVTSLNVSDPIIYLAANNYSSDAVGIGFAGNYFDGSAQRHAGLVRMEASNTFYLFTNYDAEFDTNTLDLTNASLFQAELRANVTANTVLVRNVDVLDHANASYDQANTGTILAQAAFDTANNAVDTWVRDAANSASSYANSAFDQANTANTLAQAAYDAANNATDAWVRDAANSASSYANGAFAAANTVELLAQAAFDTANSGGGATTDSYARAHANAAYAQANSGGSEIYVASLENFTSDGTNTEFSLAVTPTSANQMFVYVDGVYQQASAYSLTGNTITLSEALDANSILEVRVLANTTPSQLGVRVNEFVGTGACTTFSLSSTPLNKNLTSVIVGGVPQIKSSYTISGSSIVFSEAPSDGANVEVTVYSGGGGYAASFSTVVDTFNGDDSSLEFTLSTRPQNENHTFVYLNGVYQNKSVYSISGSNVVFTEAATANDVLEVVTVAGSEMNVTSARYNSRIYTGDDTTTDFTISSGHSANSVLVFENGICQAPITDYTVSGTTLTFTTAPANGIQIQIRELPV